MKLKERILPDGTFVGAKWLLSLPEKDILGASKASKECLLARSDPTFAHVTRKKECRIRKGRGVALSNSLRSPTSVFGTQRKENLSATVRLMA